MSKIRHRSTRGCFPLHRWSRSNCFVTRDHPYSGHPDCASHQFLKGTQAAVRKCRLMSNSQDQLASRGLRDGLFAVRDNIHQKPAMKVTWADYYWHMQCSVRYFTSASCIFTLTIERWVLRQVSSARDKKSRKKWRKQKASYTAGRRVGGRGVTNYLRDCTCSEGRVSEANINITLPITSFWNKVLSFSGLLYIWV